MRNFILSLIFLSCIIQTLFAQIQQFDSAYIVASSLNFNYKNPNFEKRNSISYVNPNYITLAYERWDTLNSRSNIIARKVFFNSMDSEVLVTNDNFLNNNPSVSHTIIVWQSNRNSNIDIFYSTYDGTNWSLPQVLQPTPEYEFNPTVAEMKRQNMSPAYYITYQRNGDIFLKIFHENNFLLDTNLTSGISESCLNPKVKITGNNFYITYLKSINSINRIVLIKAILNSNYSLSWLNTYEINQSRSISDINFVNGNYYNTGFLNYNYDTLNTFHSMGINLDNLERNIFTSNYSGVNLNGTGSFIISIADNTINNFYFSVFGWLRKTNDSSMIMAGSRFSNFFVQRLNRFYLGDSSINAKLDMSDDIPNTLAEFMFRVVWDQKINNRSVIMESKSRDYVDNIINQNIHRDNYFLDQNFPNPFNPSTTIKFYIPTSSFVKLKIFNSAGKEITTIVSQNLSAGKYDYDFNASKLESGIYFYQLISKDSYGEAGEYKQTRKMVFLK